MAQQTAVEWLVNELLFIQSLKEGEITESNKGILTASTIEQAKQMEKEQIIGLLKWMNDVAKDTPMRLETDNDDIVEQYYNKTYNVQ